MIEETAQFIFRLIFEVLFIWTGESVLFMITLGKHKMGGQKIENLKAENMKMKYAKSKLFLYDTASGKRLFHDLIQKGYSVWSEVKLSEAIVTLVALDPLPATTAH